MYCEHTLIDLRASRRPPTAAVSPGTWRSSRTFSAAPTLKMSALRALSADWSWLWEGVVLWDPCGWSSLCFLTFEMIFLNVFMVVSLRERWWCVRENVVHWPVAVLAYMNTRLMHCVHEAASKMRYSRISRNTYTRQCVIWECIPVSYVMHR